MELRFLSVVLLMVLGGTCIDMVGDLGKGESSLHLALEGLIALMATIGLAILVRRTWLLKKENQALSDSVEKNSRDFAAWRERSSMHIRGLSDAIDAQLTSWKLTSAEQEVARLLLKGLSLKEIAVIRETSERTTRQQSLGVYEKSGLAGRAELSAFFLEDLLGTPGMSPERKPDRKVDHP